jgi:hypothetical protein
MKSLPSTDAGVPFDRRVAVVPDVLVRVIGEEAILLHLGTEQYLGLDAVGTRMWTVLKESASIEAGYAELCREYDVSPDVLREDLASFVHELLAQSLISLEPAAA